MWFGGCSYFVKARDAMRSSLPLPFRDGSFMRALKNDQTTKKCLQQLLTVLQVPITDPTVWKRNKRESGNEKERRFKRFLLIRLRFYSFFAFFSVFRLLFSCLFLLICPLWALKMPKKQTWCWWMFWLPRSCFLPVFSIKTLSKNASRVSNSRLTDNWRQQKKERKQFFFFSQGFFSAALLLDWHGNSRAAKPSNGCFGAGHQVQHAVCGRFGI